MKKTLLTFITILCNLTLFAQNFPGTSPELLLNKIVKPKQIQEMFQQYAYEDFFIEFDKEKKQFTKPEKDNKPLPTGPSYAPRSDYQKLVGKEFKVLAIYEMVPKYDWQKKQYAIELQSDEFGTIYYSYNSEYESSYELEVVGGINYPEGFFCHEITTEVDKFEKSETYYTPTEEGISFMKVKKGGKSSTYLSVSVPGSTLNVNKKGLYILFSDGTKFSKPEAKIDVDANSSGYRYSAFIWLTQAEILMFTKKTITDIKLYIYTDPIETESSKMVKEYLKCLSKK
ncbi:hypothetical protein [Flavobacterium sp.]|uniref:hypothetical protein n=1 Tax=Flavobacterium sp. TaxID=239 RepID=UPI004033C62E